MQSVKVFVLATLVVISEFALYSIRWIVLLALMGIGLGAIIGPSLTWLERRLKLPRPLAGVALTFLGFLSLGGVIFLFSAMVLDQVQNAQGKLPGLLHALQLRVDQGVARYAWMNALISNFSLNSVLLGTAKKVLQGFRMGTSAIAGLVFVGVIAFYTAIGLRLIGIDYWLLLGVIAALLDVVPYVGAIVPGSLALMIAFATDPKKAIWVLAVFVTIHQLENNVLIPVVMKSRMQFPPVLLITFMLMMATFFGVVGILVSPGIFTVIRTLYLMLYVPWINRSGPKAIRPAS